MSDVTGCRKTQVLDCTNSTVYCFLYLLSEIENQKLFIESKSEFVVGQNDLLMTLKSYIQGEPLPNVPVSEKSKKGYIRKFFNHLRVYIFVSLK